MDYLLASNASIHSFPWDGNKGVPKLARLVVECRSTNNKASIGLRPRIIAQFDACYSQEPVQYEVRFSINALSLGVPAETPVTHTFFSVNEECVTAYTS